MTEDWSCALDHSRLSHELIDGEVVAIDNETGTYLSISGSAADVWSLLTEGTSRTAAAAALASRYSATEEDAGRAADEVVEKLRALGLVRNVDAADAEPDGAPSSDRPPLPAAVVEVYTDMQDLLLFDPIHEVDTSGWPNQAS